jgi:hypothetical protein
MGTIWHLPVVLESGDWGANGFSTGDDYTALVEPIVAVFRHEQLWYLKIICLSMITKHYLMLSLELVMVPISLSYRCAHRLQAKIFGRKKHLFC